MPAPERSGRNQGRSEHAARRSFGDRQASQGNGVAPIARARETDAWNCHDLLFDDVICVQKARSDHADFVLKMEDRDIEVYDIQDLLTEVFNQSPEGRAFVLDRRITPNYVGPTFVRLLRPWLDELDGQALARHLLGGIVMEDLPKDMVTPLMREVLSESEFILRPIPNALFQRDPSCWIYGGVTCNPMFWPARKPETLVQRTVYKFTRCSPGTSSRSGGAIATRIRAIRAWRAATSCPSARASC